MRNIILTLFLLSFIETFGQTKELSVDLKLMPGVSTTYYPEKFSLFEYHRYSMNGGIGVLKELKTNKLYLSSGLLIIDRGLGMKIHVTDMNGNNPRISICSDNFYYLNLPLQLVARFGLFYFGAGPDINYYLTRRFIVDKKLISKERLPWTKTFLYGVTVTAGTAIDFGTKYTFHSELYVKPTFQSKYLNYGLNIGLGYKFFKADKK